MPHGSGSGTQNINFMSFWVPHGQTTVLALREMPRGPRGSLSPPTCTTLSSRAHKKHIWHLPKGTGERGTEWAEPQGQGHRAVPSHSNGEISLSPVRTERRRSGPSGSVPPLSCHYSAQSLVHLHRKGTPVTITEWQAPGFQLVCAFVLLLYTTWENLESPSHPLPPSLTNVFCALFGI